MASPATLLAASTYDVFLANPLGRYFVGKRFVAWAASSTLIGYTFWGSPTVEDADNLSRPIDLPRPSTIAPKCNVILNVQRVDMIDFATFEHLLVLTRTRLARYEDRIARQAIVRPQGLVGAIAEGFANLVAPAYKWRVFHELDAALIWLEETERRAQVDQMQRVVDEALGNAPELAQLRAWFAAQPASTSIDEAAHGLRLSRRSLQRLLASAGTSFRDERDRYVVNEAMRYLRETDDKIDVIARRFGFASTSSFSTFFRRRTGTTPGNARGDI